MKFGDILKSAGTNLMRNKGRTILTIVAIFIGSFTIALTNGVNIGVNDYIDKQVNGVGGEDQLVIRPSTGTSEEDSDEPQKYDPDKKAAGMNQPATLDEKDIKKIEDTAGIKSIEPSKNYAINYITGANDEKYEFQAMPSSGLKVDLEAGKMVDNKSSDYEITIMTEYVKALGFKSAKDAIGQTVEISADSSATGEETILEAKIVGVRNESLINGLSLLNDSLIDELATITEKGLPDSMKGQYGAATATMDKDAYSTTEATTDLKDRLEKAGYTGLTLDDQIGTIRTVINGITGVLTMFGAIALLAASFGIINTLFMSVQERTREIGLMKAMGLSSGKIFSIFSFEAALIGFLGSALGILGAMGIAGPINNLVADSFLSGMPGLDLLQFSWDSAGLIVLIIMAIAFLAGTLPARRAAKLDPIESLRYE